MGLFGPPSVRSVAMGEVTRDKFVKYSTSQARSDRNTVAANSLHSILVVADQASLL
jgi:hypothetical protein